MLLFFFCSVTTTTTLVVVTLNAVTLTFNTELVDDIRWILFRSVLFWRGILKKRSSPPPASPNTDIQTNTITSPGSGLLRQPIFVVAHFGGNLVTAGGITKRCTQRRLFFPKCWGVVVVVVVSAIEQNTRPRLQGKLWKFGCNSLTTMMRRN